MPRDIRPEQNLGALITRTAKKNAGSALHIRRPNSRWSSIFFLPYGFMDLTVDPVSPFPFRIPSLNQLCISFSFFLFRFCAFMSSYPLLLHKNKHRLCLVREIWEFCYGSTFIFIWQLVFNHGLIRLKTFVS